MLNISRHEAKRSLDALMEKVVRSGTEETDWLRANLMNWLAEPTVDSSKSTLHNLIWAAGDYLEDVTKLILYLGATNNNLSNDFPDEFYEIRRFADKVLRRRHIL